MTVAAEVCREIYSKKNKINNNNNTMQIQWSKLTDTDVKKYSTNERGKLRFSFKVGNYISYKSNGGFPMQSRDSGTPAKSDSDQQKQIYNNSIVS